MIVKSLIAMALCLGPLLAVAQDWPRSPEESAAVIRKNHDALFEDAGRVILGSPDAKIRLVEFSDYNCGFCRQTQPQIERFLKDRPDVSVVIREFPVFGEGSIFAAKAALAAAEQGRYADMHNALMALHGRADALSVMRAARRIGLDEARLKRDMAGDAVARHIARSMDLAERLEVVGTPTFVAGDHVILGFQSRGDLAELAADAGQN